MTGKERALLKSASVAEAPSVYIGKEGLTPEVTLAVEEAFNNKELVKIAVQKSCLTALGDLAETVAQRTRSQLVSVVGRKIVLFKPENKH